LPPMPSHLSHGASGALRRFAGWVARGSELDDDGEPVNEKHAERRAATWLYRYCTGNLPPGEPDLEPLETALY
jgi:hypothetical protein